MGGYPRWWALIIQLLFHIFMVMGWNASLEAFANLIKFKVYNITKIQE